MLHRDPILPSPLTRCQATQTCYDTFHTALPIRPLRPNTFAQETNMLRIENAFVKSTFSSSFPFESYSFTIRLSLGCTRCANSVQLPSYTLRSPSP